MAALACLCVYILSDILDIFILIVHIGGRQVFREAKRLFRLKYKQKIQHKAFPTKKLMVALWDKSETSELKNPVHDSEKQ